MADCKNTFTTYQAKVVRQMKVRGRSEDLVKEFWNRYSYVAFFIYLLKNIASFKIFLLSFFSFFLFHDDKRNLIVRWKSRNKSLNRNSLNILLLRIYRWWNIERERRRTKAPWSLKDFDLLPIFPLDFDFIFIRCNDERSCYPERNIRDHYRLLWSL